MAHFKEPFCQESGKIENHLLPCNALLKKLAFAICLHGKAAITLQDISVSQPYKCSFLVSGCLFSKVEQSLPKQNSIKIMGLAVFYTEVCFTHVQYNCTLTLRCHVCWYYWKCGSVPEWQHCSFQKSLHITRTNWKHVCHFVNKRQTKNRVNIQCKKFFFKSNRNILHLSSA